MEVASSKPLIGITGRRIAGRDMGAPSPFVSADLDAYLTEYADGVLQAGGIPVHLPMAAPVEVLDRLDGLVFSGGSDVDPRRYGRAPGRQSGLIDPLRDAFETALFAGARAAAMPVLGICRGAQLINVALGGTLVEDLPVGVGESHSAYVYPRDRRTHEVEFVPGSLAHELYGRTAAVNSFHHQSVEEAGSGVVVTGRASDGVVEAFEVAGEPVFAVQWHPECLVPDPAFNWIVRSAARYGLNRNVRRDLHDTAARG